MTKSICLIIAIVGMTAMTANTHAAQEWHALVRPSGSVRLTLGGSEVATVEPGLFESGWRGGSLDPSGQAAPLAGTVRGALRAPGGGTVACELHADASEGRLRLAYRLTPQTAMNLNSLHVSVNVPMRHVAGRAVAADGQAVPVPADFAGQVHLRSEPTRSVRVPVGEESGFELLLDAPAPVLLQDNRQWGPSLSVRIGPQMDAATPWAAGRALEVAFQLQAPEAIELEFDEPVTVHAGEEWVPLRVELDVEPGSALDFSALLERERPAGSLGWLMARPDGQLAFERAPERPRRFCGVNLCFSAHYIRHDQADRLAERLMRLGYNTVRFHHYEGELVDRSAGTTTTFQPDRLDQLDYLFAALKERGIYVTTDLFVSRPVLAREIWPGAEGDARDFKMLVPVNESAFENWKAFAANLLTHVNPYTGTSYAADPALAWLSMINEGNMANYIGGVEGRTAEDWRSAWNGYLAERYGTREALREAWGDDPGGDPSQGTVPLHRNAYEDTPRSRDLVAFLAEMERRMFARMKQFVRDELGCRALLTNMNGWSNTVQSQAARADFDYVDDHFYVDHPQFIERSWRLPSRIGNVSPVSEGIPGGRGNAFVRLMDKPFTISEFNYAAPARYRGVGGILTGALAALQDWGVLWRFAYSHSRDNLFEPRPVGYFDLASDPLNQAAERAALCLFLRGDMRAAPHSVAIVMTSEELLSQSRRRIGLTPPWNGLAGVTRVGTFLADAAGQVPADIVLPLGWGRDPGAYGAGALDADPYAPETGPAVLEAMRARGWLEGNRTDLARNCLHSETGELLVDAPRDVMVLDTPRTAGCFAPEGQTVQAGPVTVTVQQTGATVWVSSVDDQPITESSRLIITHLTDLQNEGARFGEKERCTLLSWGGLPYLVRAGSATAQIRVRDAGRARVYALTTGGRRAAPVDAEVRDGLLVVPLDVRGPEGARMIYEVEMP